MPTKTPRGLWRGPDGAKQSFKRFAAFCLMMTAIFLGTAPEPLVAGDQRVALVTAFLSAMTVVLGVTAATKT